RQRPEQRTAAQKKTLAAALGKKDAGLKSRFDEIAALRKTESAAPTTMVLQELPKPRVTHVHLGGDFTRKGEQVQPGVPAVLRRLPTAGPSSRVDLARWLVDRNNPLLGRVTVNRIWQHYFGKGLVETENDFGTQGLPPTPPALLDWLATELSGSPT